MLLSGALFVFSLLFGIWFFIRNFGDSKLISAEICDVSEGFEIVAGRAFKTKYYYPILHLKYSEDGGETTTYIGEPQSRMYRVRESENPEKDYFWRALKPGDSMDIEVSLKHPQKIRLPGKVAKDYESENKVFLVLAVGFLLLSALNLI